MPAPMDFEKMIRDMKHDIVQLRQRGPFANTGLRAAGPGVLQSEGYIPATSGFQLDGRSGVAEFKDVVLYDLPNSMLANPVVPQIGRASASNFALTTSWAALASQTLTVPTGCTRVLATCSARLYAINPRTTGGADGTGTDALFVSVQLAGQSSEATPTGISGSNGFATSTCDESFILDGLTPGSTLPLAVYGTSGYQTLAANPDNRASYSATLIWLR